MRLRQVLIPVLLVIAILFLCLNCGGDLDGKDAANGIVEKVTDVKVKTIAPQNFSDYIEVTGKVEADIATTISAEESGVIEIFVKEKGDWVNKNAVIIKLNRKILQASYDEAKAMYLLNKATFERQANLYNDKVISEQKYLEFKYSLDQALARYENLEARLDKTEIKSPISGYLDGKLAEVGEFVQPGMPLMTIVKIDVVKISAGVPERFVRDVKLGSKATITFSILADVLFEGKVTFIGPSINKTSRTFPIEIKINNKEKLLKPEMFANIHIEKKNTQNAVVIPRDAIIETETGKYVFLNQNNIAMKREVQIGGAYENNIWITTGLKPGDQIIVVGHRELADGERIAVHE